MNAHSSTQWLIAFGCLATFSLSFVEHAHAASRPDISEELSSGHLAAAKDALTTHLATEPKDDLARFQLGAVQFFAAIQGLAQDSYRYGLKSNFGMIPFLRTPIKRNSQPEPVTYNDVRKMIERFAKAEEEAQATLAPIKDKNLAWDLDLTAVRLDMNGDGEAGSEESLWNVFQQFASRGRQTQKPESLVIGLDSADVHWLQGYCHLLSALGEMVLAYDHQKQFDYTAQLFFGNPQTPYSELFQKSPDQERWNQSEIMDAIAFIHLASYPIKEPERLVSARDHLLAMIESSRKSWELIEAETDNNREWIPGPGQTSVVEGVAINKERLAAWHRFLLEAESILNGKTLIPFWRGSSGKGVNLMKVFTQPRDFDVVMWVQGSGAVPYLEEGEVTSTQTWAEFQRVFQGQFLGMAIWIN